MKKLCSRISGKVISLLLLKPVLWCPELILVVSGSPRRNGNTDYVCSVFMDEAERLGRATEFVRVADYRIKPCISCRTCLDRGECVIRDDDMSRLYNKLLAASAIVIASPVYFNNVTAQLKAFMDRTWCLRGKLKDKVGGAIVVGRRYGHEAAVNAIVSFMLKHEMILGMRGVVVFGYEKGDVMKDRKGLEDVRKLARRVDELLRKLEDTTAH